MTAPSQSKPAPDSGPGEAALAILEERARALARPLVADDDQEGLTLLTFGVAGRPYAVATLHVREVLASAEVSCLPWAPPAVAGVINVRGSVVAVVDAARRLGLGSVQAGSPVVVLDDDGDRLGLLVDAVNDVVSITADEIASLTGDRGGIAPDLVLGVTTSAVVLDGRVLATEFRLTANPQEGT